MVKLGRSFEKKSSKTRRSPVKQETQRRCPKGVERKSLPKGTKPGSLRQVLRESRDSARKGSRSKLEDYVTSPDVDEHGHITERAAMKALIVMKDAKIASEAHLIAALDTVWPVKGDEIRSDVFRLLVMRGDMRDVSGKVRNLVRAEIMLNVSSDNPIDMMLWNRTFLYLFEESADFCKQFAKAIVATPLFLQRFKIHTRVFNHLPTDCVSKLVDAIRACPRLYPHLNFLDYSTPYAVEAFRGSVDAMFRVAQCYHHGSGVERDLGKAVQYFRYAAERGHSEAMRCLGVCINKGEGVAQDKVAGFRWMLKAAKSGDCTAMEAVGLCYLNGDVVQESTADARLWFSKAMDLGSAIGICNLGLMSLHGKGCHPNPQYAFELFHRAATMGLLEAQRNLAACYYSGIGVRRNELKSRLWYGEAASRGDTQSVEALREMNIPRRATHKTMYSI